MENMDSGIRCQQLEELYKKYSDMVFRLALIRLKNTHDAEDVLQSVFLRAYKADKHFESEEHQKAWLIRVTLNCTNSVFGSAWRKHLADWNDNIREDYLSDQDDDFSDIFDAVNKLPKDQSTVVHLYYYEEYSVKEIAEIMGKSESNVKTTLFRARQTLRMELKDEYESI